MDIEFVDRADTLAASSAVARVVFQGETIESILGRAAPSTRFSGSRGQVLSGIDLGPERGWMTLVGGGDQAKFDLLAAEEVAGKAYEAVKFSGANILRVDCPHQDADVACHLGLGARLAAYRFAKYRTRETADKRPSISTVQIATPYSELAKHTFRTFSAVADGVYFARDLVSEPGNVLFPREFAARMRALEALGLQVEVLGEAEMTELGMGALIGVGQGSARESQLVVARWSGDADPTAPPVAFVGKGVCFDTGGISIKPADGMEGMKWDMGGAAAVAGLMHVLASRKAMINAVGVLGLTENMPDGNAQRPGDVVTSMSGQTIEIINTDAEGRLVLADALTYCLDKLKPSLIVDLATLTGAIIYALGHDFAGLFSNDDELAEKLLLAAGTEGEGLWRMPMPKSYERHIESAIADVKNTGPRAAGSINAALFLRRFVGECPWAHIDMASTAWRDAPGYPTTPEGATGFGVRLLNRFVSQALEV